jgi:secreted PhoX family phosphatase
MRKCEEGGSAFRFSRRGFLKTGLAGGAAAAALPALAGAANTTASPLSRTEIQVSELDEITIGELQNGMRSGKYTARSLVQKYLERIETID